MSTNKYIKVAYTMSVETPASHKQLYEATFDQPDQFVSGMGMMIDAFEEHVTAVAEGESFSFLLQPDEAFGEKDATLIIDVPRKSFEINGRFDDENIFEGAQVPLTNPDGDRFYGTVVEVKPESVTIDLNDPLAGIPLRFAGTVLENREPTLQEIERTTQILSGEDCECGCGCGEGHECHCKEDHAHDCHCHHDHHHDEGHCCCHHHE